MCMCENMVLQATARPLHRSVPTQGMMIYVSMARTGLPKPVSLIKSAMGKESQPSLQEVQPIQLRRTASGRLSLELRVKDEANIINRVLAFPVCR